MWCSWASFVVRESERVTRSRVFLATSGPYDALPNQHHSFHMTSTPRYVCRVSRAQAACCTKCGPPTHAAANESDVVAAARTDTSPTSNVHAIGTGCHTLRLQRPSLSVLSHLTLTWSCPLALVSHTIPSACLPHNSVRTGQSANSLSADPPSLPTLAAAAAAAVTEREVQQHEQP